jgi:hypothetical protein
MVVLALVLLILVVVFSVAIAVSNPTVYDLSLFRVLVPVTSAGMYFTGVGAALVTLVALLLLRFGVRRSRERRQRLRAAEQSGDSTPAAAPGGAPAPSGPTANLELDPPPATAGERRALPDEVDELSRDDPKR